MTKENAGMKVIEILDAANVRIETQPQDKLTLLRDLCTSAAPLVGLAPQILLTEIIRREQLGSTGIGDGIAIPHTRAPELTKPYGSLVRLTQPIEFDSIDGEPVDLVFFLVLPGSPPSAHLNSLACVTRTLRDPTILADIRKAASAAALYTAVTQPITKL